MTLQKSVVPQQHAGGSVDESHSITTLSRREAIELYHSCVERLLNANQWEELAGGLSAKFSLTDNKGVPVQRSVRLGDFFRIAIPGPGNLEGDGYDWVMVEQLNESHDAGNDEERTFIQVRPAGNPGNDHNDTAHFFSDQATSTFMVRRKGNEVTASIHGRNEFPNTSTTTTVDKLRNAVVAAGALAGISSLQWKALAHGIMGG